MTTQVALNGPTNNDISIVYNGIKTVMEDANKQIGKFNKRTILKTYTFVLGFISLIALTTWAVLSSGFTTGLLISLPIVGLMGIVLGSYGAKDINEEQSKLCISINEKMNRKFAEFCEEVKRAFGEIKYLYGFNFGTFEKLEIPPLEQFHQRYLDEMQITQQAQLLQQQQQQQQP